MKKTCCTCKVAKDTADFAANRSRPDGLQAKCKTCVNTYNSAYYGRTKDRHNPKRYERRDRVRAEGVEKLAEYLRQHPCVDCGETDIVVLDFDHQRDKRANVSMLVRHGRPWETVLREIEKCEVVCANDHRRRTAQAQGWAKAAGLTAGSSAAELLTLNQ